MINIKFYDFSFAKIDTSKDILNSLKKKFSYFEQGYMYAYSYIKGYWDGKTSLINKDLIPTGLLKPLFIYCRDNNLPIKIDKNYENKVQDFEFLKDIKLFSNKKTICLREDQWVAVSNSIKNNRIVCVCPTSFGKSLCIYLNCLYHKNYGRKTIIIVPKKELVRQMISDFKDYGYEGSINGIFSGQKRISSDITVSTYQSLIKCLSLLKDFDNIIIDETHLAKSNSIKTILSNSGNIRYRSGWTGTLKEDSLSYIMAQAYVGSLKVITNTIDLMNEKVVAQLKISVIRILHENRICFPKTYLEEKNFIRKKSRYDLVLSLVDSFGDKNGILFVKEIEDVEKFYDLAKIKYPNKNIYQIRGGLNLKNDIKYKSFNELKEYIENENNSLLIVSLQVFSTGISLKNIYYGIMATTTKAYNTIIQTIGRGLRKNSVKKIFYFLDIYDDIREDEYVESYMYKHLLERVSYYKEHGFKIKYKTIKLKEKQHE